MLAGLVAKYVGAPLTVASIGSIVILLALLLAWCVSYLRRYFDAEPVVPAA